jgi:hypothetical protein
MAPSANDKAAAPKKSGAAAEIPDLSTHATVLYGSRYELVSLIGVGGGGSVYRARDIELDELVALKVLRKELLSDREKVERFRNEVRLARRVTHRNVARMFDMRAPKLALRRCRRRGWRRWSTPAPAAGGRERKEGWRAGMQRPRDRGVGMRAAPHRAAAQLRRRAGPRGLFC